ncbi:MAG: Dam family site-specific DNA-(adenine-N6)-methyltransferase [Firmicutes bacterium]|nr:Dam family site-specific DNA-(adenine-N6)-methyltransferase [Bacillota bacterium]
MIRPFLKWAGGKARLVECLRDQLGPGARLVEPFVGSAAVWLNTDFPSSLLADANADLIRVYETLKTEGPSFIADCRRYFTPETNTAEAYYALRDRFNETRDAREKAALFVYLNRHGYNGLCRYNASGLFNVPFGRYRRPYFPAAEMEAFWRKARRATFVVADFRTVLASVRPGDVVYCDPPYVPLSSTANFTDYAAAGFSWQDQEDLVCWAERLSAQGIRVVISNHATAWTRARYQNARQLVVPVSRSISCRGSQRRPVEEIVAVFDGREG